MEYETKIDFTYSSSGENITENYIIRNTQVIQKLADGNLSVTESFPFSNVSFADTETIPFNFRINNMSNMKYELSGAIPSTQIGGWEHNYPTSLQNRQINAKELSYIFGLGDAISINLSFKNSGKIKINSENISILTYFSYTNFIVGTECST